MLIETQETPDRNVLNFFPPVRILKSGTAEFVDAKSLRKSPLAEQIFDLGGIKSLFMTAEMISVTKEDEAVIETPETAADETDVVNRIIGLINARIRPAVKQDGGDIVFKNFADGIVYVEMRGNCAGCPYAMITLKEGVERVLKSYIPEVKEVRNFENSEA